MSIPGLETKRLLFTGTGHKILIDETSNTLELVHASGPDIIMTNDAITLKVGNTTLAIKADGVYINDKVLKTSQQYFPIVIKE